jgi:hypothetical protein
LQLTITAVVVAIVSIALLIVASLAPLGLVDPFPDPPITRSKVPWAQTRPISDPATLNRRPGEGDHAYFKRLAVSVSAAIVHWWPEGDPAASQYTRVTFLSDYAVWSMSKLARWGNFQNYEFMSPGSALERGFGFCSQQARIIFSVLLDNGYRPAIMVHEQHTVLEVNGTIIDGSYGVFIPRSLDDLQDKPYLVSFFYVNFPDELPLLTKVFTEGFTKFSDMETLSGMLSFERKIQYLKWQIPIGGLILAMVLGALGRKLMSTADGAKNNDAAFRFAQHPAE